MEMEYGVWSIECGVRSTRVWSTEYTSMEYGVLSVEYGVHEYGVRSTAPELGVHGLWSMEYCRWRNPCQGLILGRPLLVYEGANAGPAD